MPLLTGPHELVDFRGAALRLLHAIAFLQQVVHLGQVDPGVRRHAVGGDLPEQHPERCSGRKRENKSIRYEKPWAQRKRKSTLGRGAAWVLPADSPHTSDLMEKVL